MAARLLLAEDEEDVLITLAAVRARKDKK